MGVRPHTIVVDENGVPNTLSIDRVSHATNTTPNVDGDPTNSSTRYAVTKGDQRYKDRH